MPIPVYRLPILVTRCIVDRMETVDLLFISHCSKRADRVLKLCNKKDVTYFNLSSLERSRMNALKRLELFLMEAARTDKTVLKTKEFYLKITVSDFALSLELHSKDLLRICLDTECIRKMDQRIGKQLHFGDVCVPAVATGYEKVRTFWDQETEGLLDIVNFFIINFKCMLDLDFHGDGSEFLTNIRKITQYTMQPHVSVGNASLTTEHRIPHEDLKFILENLKVNGKFDIDVEARENFQFNGGIQAPHLNILGHSPWFSLRHLLNGNSEKVDIDIDDLEYPESEVNWFLEEWMAGKFPELKKLDFEMDINPDEFTLPKGWTKDYCYRGYYRDHVYKYEGVIGNRKVIAQIALSDGGSFKMGVRHSVAAQAACWKLGM